MNYKPLRYALTAIFSLGAIALLGILSYTGMLYLTGNVIASLVSAGLAVIIEGEIFKRNILSGVSKFLEFGQFIERDSYCNKLKELSEKYFDNTQNSSLLKDYYELRKYKKKLEHAERLSDEQQKELDRCESHIGEIEEFFIRYMNNQLDNSNPIEKKLEANLDHHLKNDKSIIHSGLQSNIWRERFWLWLSIPFTVGGGIMAMLVAFAQLPEALIALNLTVTPVLTTFLIWPLSILAGIGLMLITYNTFVEVIHNKKWIKHWENFKKTLKNSTSPAIAFHVITMFLITGLAIFATIATASTWWVAAQTGIALLPFLSTLTIRTQTIIISVGATLFALGQVVFEYVNSLESHATLTHRQLPKGLTKGQQDYINKLSVFRQFFTVPALQAMNDYDVWVKKPWSERFNIFTWIITLIEIPFRLVIFIGHLISIGVTGDRLGNIHPAITSTVGALQEAMTDLHYVWSGKCNHHHYDFAGLFLNICLSPLKFAAASWNWFFGKAGFSECCRIAFNWGEIKDIKKREPSAELQLYELDKKIAQEQARLEEAAILDDAAVEKLNLWSKVREATQKATPVLKSNESKSQEKQLILFNKDDIAILDKHRSTWFGPAVTKSMQTVEEIKQEFPNLTLSSA